MSFGKIEALKNDPKSERHIKPTRGAYVEANPGLSTSELTFQT